MSVSEQPRAGSDPIEDPYRESARWARVTARVWPVVRGVLDVVAIAAWANGHEGLALSAETLVVIGNTATEFWRVRGR